MASFSFQFDLDETTQDDAVESAQHTDESEPLPKQVAVPFEWVQNVQELLHERRQEVLVYVEVNLGSNPPSDVKKHAFPIRFVDLTQSSYQKPKNNNTEIPEVWKDTDIQPGVYEGGRKVWEGSWDLLHYLHKQWRPSEVDVRRVWERGCGHGLPGCYALRQYSDAHVYFTDYNQDVVLDATLSNIVLNTQAELGDTADERTHVGFGDWLDMPSLDTGFDLILSAETLYTTEAALSTCELLDRHLTPETGVALVATKRYYFGVGGGVDVFREACEGRLDVATVEVLDGGIGNIREILRVTKPCSK